MADPRGRLDPLTIGAIFVVVLTLMYGGIQFSEGELLPPDTTNATEDRLRGAIWTELNERRSAAGVDSLPHNRFARGIAQDTADTLVQQGGLNATDDTRLPNHRPFCTQIPARVEVSALPGDDLTTDVNGSASIVADALVAEQRAPLFRPRGRFRAGLGIAVHDGAVTVVYRSCEQADT